MNTRSFAVSIAAALLAVFTLASSAWAECAWLLWSETEASGRVVFPYAPVEAYERKADCETGLGAQLAAFKRVHARLKEAAHGEMENLSVIGERASVTATSRIGDKVWEQVSLKCLPDTIDPRGSRSK